MTLVDDFLFVFGGTLSNNSVDDSLWAWDVRAERWYHLLCVDGEESCPRAVSDHTATSVSIGQSKMNQIYFIGESGSVCVCDSRASRRVMERMVIWMIRMMRMRLLLYDDDK